jgi:hypothetical protein
VKAKLFWLMLLFAVLFFIGNNYLENKNRQRQQETARNAARLEIQNSISTIVNRYDAVDNWGKQLSLGKRVRTSSILSLELQRVWIVHRPIFFIGFIKDIVTLNEETYLLTLERTLFSQEVLLKTKLRLAVRASKTQVDTIIATHPDLLENTGLRSELGVVAQIENISITQFGDLEDIKTGNGYLLDLVYAGNGLLRRGIDE